MQISDEGKIGIALALLGIGGGGALFVLPHPYADYVGWSLIGTSVVGGIGLGLFHFGCKFAWSELKLRRIFFAWAAATAIAVWYIAGIPISTLMLLAPKIAQPSTPIAPPQQPPSSSLDSTWSKAYYKCKWDGVMPDQKTLEKNTAEFRQYISVYAETLTAIAMFPTIKGGDKAQLIPSAATGDAMGNFAEITFETRRLGKDLLGIFTAKYKQDPYGAVSSQKMLPGSDLEIKIRRRIEDLTGVARGDCELQ